MGLDTTHDCWHGPYSAFSRWRDALALAAGYAVWNVDDGRGFKRPLAMVDWGHLGTTSHLNGYWEETPADPLLVLIVHSDCDGAIYPTQAGPLADRIEQLIPAMGQMCGLPRVDNDLADLRRRSARFVAGLRKAAAAGEPVLF